MLKLDQYVVQYYVRMIKTKTGGGRVHEKIASFEYNWCKKKNKKTAFFHLTRTVSFTGKKKNNNKNE